MYSIRFMIFVLVFFTSNLNLAQDDKGTEIQDGQIHYNIIMGNTKLPKYGGCWLNAVKDLKIGCRHLTDDIQSHLSLMFANCFLEQAGLPTFPCRREQPIKECLINITTNAFTSYSNFFGYTRSMCHFLNAQIWQEETENILSNLTNLSKKVASRIEISSEVQEKMLNSQLVVLEHQKQLIADGNLLNNFIDASKLTVKEMMAEFRSSTDEQRFMILDVFDRLSNLQALVMNEVSWFYTILFYCCGLLVVYIASASKRTSDSRLWLILVLSLNFCLERVICRYSLDQEEFVNNTQVELTNLNAKIWLVRRFSAVVCICILLYFIFTFTDYVIVNNHLLEEIRQQNLEIKQSMKLFNVSSTQNISGNNAQSISKSNFISPYSDNNDRLSAYSINEIDEENISMYSESSWDSVASDRTWCPDDVSFDDDFVDKSSQNFLSSLVSNKSDNSATTQSIDSNNFSVLSPPFPKASNTRRRSSRCSTPITHHYELRSKSVLCANPKASAILEEESPDNFGRMISHLASVSHQQSLAWKRKIEKQAAIVEEKTPKKQ